MKHMKRWYGVQVWEIFWCIGAWLVGESLSSSISPIVQWAWRGMGVFIGILIMCSYRTGVDYQSETISFYRRGRRIEGYFANEIQSIQLLSKRTGLLWQTHMACGFLGENEQGEPILLGISPTQPMSRWKKNFAILIQTYPELIEKVDVSRLSPKHQQHIQELLEEKKTLRTTHD